MPIISDNGKLKGIINLEVKDKNGNPKPILKRNFLGMLFQRKNINVPKHFLFGRFLFGSLVNSLTINNTITNTGKAASISRLGVSAGTTAFTYLAVGSGTTAAAATDTTLQTEITSPSMARAAATVTQETTTTTGDTLQLVKQWTATTALTVTECGALNASSAGVVLGRQVFSAVNVASSDTLQVTYKFVQA